MWEILNANNFRWGSETYLTREAAEKELRDFFKGVSGVNLNKFSFRQIEPVPCPVPYPSETHDRHGGTNGALLSGEFR